MIIEAAEDEANSHRRHRNLAHQLSRTARAFVSPSTVLRVLHSVKLVCAYEGRSRPKGEKPDAVAEARNETWA